MLSADQLEERRSGIGGSDVAAALGLSPYKTPLQLYLEKTGQADDADLSDNQAVHFGNVLEDVVCEEFTRRTGLKTRRNNRGLVHAEHPVLRANIDREIVGKVAGVRAGFEAKTADRFAASPDLWGKGSVLAWDDAGELEIVEADDKVPDWYLLQCVHYMAVTNSDLWFLGVLIGGNQYRTYVIRRDVDLEAEVIAGVLDFWNNHVLAGVPPEAVCREDLESLYPRDNGSAVRVPADDAALSAWAELKTAQAELKALEAKIDGFKSGRVAVGGLKNQLRAAIGEGAEILVDGEDKPLATWKNQKDSKRFDADAFKAAHPKLYREFQVTVPGPRVLLIK